MRIFWSLLAMAVLSACGQTTESPASTEKGIVLISVDTEDRYNLVYSTMLEGQKSVKVEEDGSANIEITGQTEIGFFLQSGAVSFFAEPGDEIMISTDEGQPVIATGNEGYDEYLSVKTGLLAESLGSMQQRMRLDSDAYLEQENHYQKLLDDNLAEFAAKLNPALVKAEQAAIRMQKATSLIQYPNYYAYLNQGQRPENDHRGTLDELLASEEAYDLSNPTFIDLHIQVAMGKEAADMMKKGESVTPENYVAFQLNSVKKHIADEEIRKVAMPKTLTSVIEFDMSQAKKEYDANKSSIAIDYQDDIEAIFDSWSTLMPGQEAPDFTTVDMEGNEVKLSDFKGKYVYVDVWASWCEPCKEEIPFLKTLDKNYSEEDIIFLSVSIDETKEPWKEMVQEQELQGTQVYIEGAFASTITQDYKISGIPRFMLIDPEGKIVTVQAQRPSGKIKETIDALLAS